MLPFDRLALRPHRAPSSFAPTSRRGFLKAGGVFDDDFIDAYIDLKMTEVIRFEHTPHPVEFDMYYSA